MADSPEKKIYQALYVKMEAFPRPSTVTLAMPGIPYSPTTTSRFISVEIHFNRSIETDVSLQMDPIRQGFMRANIMWPKTLAVVDGYELAGQVRAYLKRGTKALRDTVEVRIDEDPEIGVLVTGDTHHTIPVTIRWVSYYQPA